MKNKIDFVLKVDIPPNTAGINPNSILNDYLIDDNPKVIEWLRKEFPEFTFDTDNNAEYYAKNFNHFSYICSNLGGRFDIIDRWIEDPSTQPKKLQAKEILVDLWDRLDDMRMDYDKLVIKFNKITVQESKDDAFGALSSQKLLHVVYHIWITKPLVDILGIKCIRLEEWDL